MSFSMYTRAKARFDYSDYVVHLVKPFVDQSGRHWSSIDMLSSIIIERQIRPSLVPQILEREPLGAVCFYDVPLWGIQQLVETNPSGRTGHGIIVYKPSLWAIGGRPAIYTEKSNSFDWPRDQAFRLIHTDLVRMPLPTDWMHEREWRFRGPLNLANVWPRYFVCVDSEASAQELYRRFPGEYLLYVISLGRFAGRSEMMTAHALLPQASNLIDAGQACFTATILDTGVSPA